MLSTLSLREKMVRKNNMLLTEITFFIF